MKLLIITNLFPNAQEPGRAVFNKQQFMELSKLCELRVIAPIPYFGYSKKQVPVIEVINGIEVHHPRYLVIPKIFRCLYGLFYFLGIRRTVEEVYREFKFDEILATWAYPDAFGSALLARSLNKPLVIKVHGSDINITTRYFLRRKMVTWAFGQAQKVIAVSEALKQRIIDLGIPGEKVIVIPNGVDTTAFYPQDKMECRKKLSLPLDKKLVLFAGNLEMVKGIDLLIDAMAKVREDTNLVVVGAGSIKNQLTRKVKSLGLDGRILFAGQKAHSEIPLYMNAADLFCLPSRNEGCPNVLLEAVACRIPVVATKVGGIPEIIRSNSNGILVNLGNSGELSAGINTLIHQYNNNIAGPVSNSNISWENNAGQIFSALKESRIH